MVWRWLNSSRYCAGGHFGRPVVVAVGDLGELGSWMSAHVFQPHPRTLGWIYMRGNLAHLYKVGK